jgi:hypothetical protein
MPTSDAISLTPEETELIVNVVNGLTNGLAGLNESIRLGLTPNNIDATASVVANLLVVGAVALGPAITIICGVVNSLV